MARPKEELDKLLAGLTEWDDAPIWLQSWATFFIWQAAINFIASNRKTREEIMLQTPDTLKPQLKEMILSIRKRRQL